MSLLIFAGIGLMACTLILAFLPKIRGSPIPETVQDVKNLDHKLPALNYFSIFKDKSPISMDLEKEALIRPDGLLL